MSDFRAIGGVSATLQTLLLDRMELPDGLASVPVTIGPPPFSSQGRRSARRRTPRVNLFLYRVTENGYLQNQEIPGRGSAGGLRPSAAQPEPALPRHGVRQHRGVAPAERAVFDDTHGAVPARQRDARAPRRADRHRRRHDRCGRRAARSSCTRACATGSST